jgi:hypothetical protein
MLGFASCSMTRRPAARGETPSRHRACYGVTELGGEQIRGEPPCVMPMLFTEWQISASGQAATTALQRFSCLLRNPG